MQGLIVQESPPSQDPFGGILSAPTISLPKGGASLAGIGEKFGVNAANGTGTFALPIQVSEARSDFAPALSLSYDSGAGNGPFGLGWRLTLPAIERRTSKGVPRYRDDSSLPADDPDGPDVFIMAGTEDLVPLHGDDGTRHANTATAPGFVIHRYRPRIEGSFTRIERWTRTADGDMFWRTITGDNVTTYYGLDANSREADPADPRRIFRWLIAESHDARGNAILYRYRAEDAAGIDTAAPPERSRSRGAARYLTRILYGNRSPARDPADWRRIPAADLPADGWMFEIVFDYGEDRLTALPPDPAFAVDAQLPRFRASPLPGRDWPARPDPFSTARAGFEIRSHRRCHRILSFHHIPDVGRPGLASLPGYRGLVRDLALDYDDPTAPDPDPRTEARHPGSSRFGSVLRRITSTGYAPDPDPQAPAGQLIGQSLPPLVFDYARPTLDPAPVALPHDIRLRPGADPARMAWVDLDGEGLPGLLAAEAGGLYWRRNLGPDAEGRPQLAPAVALPAQPNLPLTDPRARLVDLGGDGRLDLALLDGPDAGFFQRNPDAAGGWAPFRPLAQVPSPGAGARLADLSGDGLADLVTLEGERVILHPSRGETGFDPARARTLPDAAGAGGAVAGDPAVALLFADMTGDGMADLVRVTATEVSFWPGLGHGRFGARVVMANPPLLDAADAFDPARLRLVDLDGSGPADLLYTRASGTVIALNQSGNRLTDPLHLPSLPGPGADPRIEAVDLFGRGSAVLLAVAPQPGSDGAELRIIDLIGPVKPGLMTGMDNSLGLETRLGYAPSTRFSLADERAGQPWITRLPFPVQVVETVEITDHVARSRFRQRHAYHHGYFDGVEREFRGFGMVEAWDIEAFADLGTADPAQPVTSLDSAADLPPVLTRSWFHTGVALSRGRISGLFAGPAGGTWQPDPADLPPGAVLTLPDTVLPPGLDAEEERQACRALKGRLLRREVFALDGSPREALPYTVSEANFDLRRLQPRHGKRPAVFLVTPREALDFHYERDPRDPRISHALTLDTDDWGNVLRSAAIAYGRLAADPSLSPQARAEQARSLATCIENRFTLPLDDPDDWRSPVNFEQRSYEMLGLVTGFAQRPSVEGLRAALSAAPVIGFDQPDPGSPARRLLGHARALRRRDDLTGALPDDQQGRQGLAFESYRLALDDAQVAEHYTPQGIGAAELGLEAGYVRLPGESGWWIPSGRGFLSPARTDTPAQELAFARRHFFLNHRYRAPFDSDAAPAETVTLYDAHDLIQQETRSPLGNRVTAGIRAADPAQPLVAGGIDYRVLSPWQVMDPNRNMAQVAFDALGQAVATGVTSDPALVPVLGDRLDGLARDLTAAQIRAARADPAGPAAAALLAGAGTRYVIDLHAWRGGAVAPTLSLALAREDHVSDLPAGAVPQLQVGLRFHDARGRVIQSKALAEPGPAPLRDPVSGVIRMGADGQPLVGPSAAERWAVSGWKVLNNKDQPVRSFEPFFSDQAGYEADLRVGVSAIQLYDALGRESGVLSPDGSWAKVVRGAWRQESWDRNDTLGRDPAADPELARSMAALGPLWAGPRWLELRNDPAHAGALARLYPDPAERAAQQRAAAVSAAHGGTPSAAHLDALGRPVALTGLLRRRAADGTVQETRTEALTLLDIRGLTRERRDARGRVVERLRHVLTGAPVQRHNMDSGWRLALHDIAGNPIRNWDARGQMLRLGYDRQRRLVTTHLRPAPGAPEALITQTIWGETLPDAEARNLRAREAEIRDQAGTQITETFDFRGNMTRSRRRLARDVDRLLDWSQPVALEPVSYLAETRHDALGRAVQMIGPFADDGGASVQVIQHRFGRGGLLDGIDVWFDRAAAPPGHLDPTSRDMMAIAAIHHDAAGRRLEIDRPLADGRLIRTRYRHDPLTGRVTGIYTRRGVDPGSGLGTGFAGDCALNPAPADPPATGDCGVQNLVLVHDPVGNVTAVLDRAAQTVFFRNRRVEPHRDYEYDSAYQLIRAAGREHLALTHDHDDWQRRHLPQPGDGNALGRYTESYDWDLAGNLLAMVHANAAGTGWRRDFTHAEASTVQPGQHSNRLTALRTGTEDQVFSTAGDGYDPHGNMLHMPHLATLIWDHTDQLRMSRRQAVNASDSDGQTRHGDTTWYVHDHSGRRIRKQTRTASGALRDERLYLGGFEIYRRGGPDPLQRDTIHLTDGGQRLAMVELRRSGTEPGVPARLIRHQLDDPLGSVATELDDQGRILSHEEYSPFGSTTFQGRAGLEAPKRYRFSGQERDEETGLNHHGARLYAPWLGRWTSADPVGLAGGDNPYAYCGGNPVSRSDRAGLQDESTTGGFGVSIDSGGNVSAGPQSFSALGPRENYTFAFGRAPGRYMDLAGTNTRLIPLNIQFHINLARGNPLMLSGEPLAEAQFTMPGPRGGLYPMFSGVLVQEVLEGTHAGTVHFDMRNVSLTPPLRGTPGDPMGMRAMMPGDFHSSSEARQIVANLASTGPGERRVETFIQHENGLSRIPTDQNRVMGSPLPERIARYMPNIDNTGDDPPGPNPTPPPAPASTPPAPARPPAAPGGGSSGSSGGGGRAPAPTPSRNAPASAPAAPSGGGGGGGAAAVSRMTAAGNTLAGSVRYVVPGVVEAEIGLGAGAMYAHAAGYGGVGVALETGAAAVPVVGGAALVGTVTGNLAEAGLTYAGAPTEVAQTGGLLAAMGAGAGVGAIIGAAGGGIGAAPGALVGAAAGGIGYLISRW